MPEDRLRSFNDLLRKNGFGLFSRIIIFATSGLLLMAFLGDLILLILAILTSDFQSATDYAAIASSVGTVFLVALTGWYATETRRMVRETERSRKQDRIQRRRNRIKKRISLRRALIEEIKKIGYYDRRADNYTVGLSEQNIVSLSEVYEANSDSLGQLTEKEVDAVVEYYARLKQLESLIQLHRTHDSPWQGDSILRYFRWMRLKIDSFVERISFGWIEAPHSARQEFIRERYSSLNDAQDRAVDVLRKELAVEREKLDNLPKILVEKTNESD